MFEGHDQPIHDLLAQGGLVEPAVLAAAFAEHRATGEPLTQTLLASGRLEKAALLRAVAGHLGHDFTPELPAALPADALAFVPGALARTYGVAPIAADRFSIAVAALDPFNPDLAGELAFALQRDVRVCVADPAGVRRLIRQHYGGDDIPVAAAAAVDDSGGEPPGDASIEQLAGQTSVIGFVNHVLTQAVRDKASDIHFEPFEHDFKIRCRIDGALSELPPPPRNLARPVISRLKVLANLNIAERRQPQDGRLKVQFEGRTVDLRISTLPTQFGESVVLRVLDQSSTRLAVDQLGWPAAIGRGVEAVIRRPNGIFLVTGPTGSGKTTTLYSCLQVLNTTDAKLLTIEDPVEYEVDGIMQVPVNLPAGLTFARALRTFLRQDPDIVMVGEMRDPETAQIAIQAALTGHLVLSTLHTNDAPSAITRLLDMGIEPFLLGSTLEAVLAQRLVRRACPACRTAYVPDDAVLAPLGVTRAALQGRPFHRAAGCPDCNRTGYRGRLGLFEFLPMTDALRELVVQGAPLLELRRKAVGQGMTSLRDAGLAAILAGDTTVEEVVKYI